MNNQKEVEITLQRVEQQRALIVDDDPDTVNLLRIIVRSAGLEVDSAYNGLEALQKCVDVQPHIILLDLMMPGMDGWETYRSLRKLTDAPVIVISAMSRKDQVIRGLQMGFDDYLVKPFIAQELIARIESVLRRSLLSKPPITVQVFPNLDFSIDYQTCEVILSGQIIPLSLKEFTILSLLAKNSPKVVNYAELSREIWGEIRPQYLSSIRHIIASLRRKLEKDPSNPKFIVNVKNIGYKFDIH